MDYFFLKFALFFYAYRTSTVEGSYCLYDIHSFCIIEIFKFWIELELDEKELSLLGSNKWTHPTSTLNG